LRSPFRPSHPSTLARHLATALPAGAAVAAPRQDVAERLGQWLNVAEAISLHAALPAVKAAGEAAARRPPRTGAPALHAALRAELERVRSGLVRSIAAAAAHRPDPADPDTELALILQRLGDQQRRMELAIDALRDHVRQQLAQSTPAMAQLAAVDAVMDKLFGGREQRLLAGLPAFLKARFATLRREAAAPASPPWLQTFGAEFEQLLLAELELRLQPVTGLIESLEA
jgi:murein DD-endopeptidase MepM/ murein hydrolase activator NlpD